MKATKNMVVWIIGANASGKSSLAANMQLKLRRKFGANQYPSHDFPRFASTDKVLYTHTSNRSANLGKFNHPGLYGMTGINTNACCGTDTLPTKELIERAVGEVFVDDWRFSTNKVVFVEGIMATRQWMKFLKTSNSEVFLILMDVELPLCLARLMARRAAKKGISEATLLEELTENTVSNIEGKIRGFKKMFVDLAPQCALSELITVEENQDINDLASKMLEKLFDYEM